MDVIAALRENIGTTRWLVGSTLEGITPELANAQPAGTANSIGSLYAHMVISEDFMINTMLKGGAPLAGTLFEGKTGVSELPPAEDSAEMAQWFKRVQVDLPALQAYAQGVYAATDAYLDTLKPQDLDRKVPFFDMGEQTTNFVIGVAAALHGSMHVGEISALKGLKGLKGYPI